MSPLTRSLLALAVLFAVADADCKTQQRGRTHPCDAEGKFEPIYFDSRGVDIDDPPSNCPAGMTEAGETVKACNDDPYGPAPDVYGWHPIHVRCSQDDPDCSGRVDITQCCVYN